MNHAEADRAARRIGVRELKTHAARILRQVRTARASYLVTHRGQAVGVILPIDAAGDSPQQEHVDAEAAWNAFVRAGRNLQRRFLPSVDGVSLLSRMRR